MAEWLKAHAWKACERRKPLRGFEPPSLRQDKHTIIKSINKLIESTGEVAEWLKALDSKSSRQIISASRVQIPLSPPEG